jgi:hypothetical protein
LFSALLGRLFCLLLSCRCLTLLWAFLPTCHAHGPCPPHSLQTFLSAMLFRPFPPHSLPLGSYLSCSHAFTSLKSYTSIPCSCMPALRSLQDSSPAMLTWTGTFLASVFSITGLSAHTRVPCSHAGYQHRCGIFRGRSIVPLPHSCVLSTSYRARMDDMPHRAFMASCRCACMPAPLRSFASSPCRARVYRSIYYRLR